MNTSEHLVLEPATSRAVAGVLIAERYRAEQRSIDPDSEWEAAVRRQVEIDALVDALLEAVAGVLRLVPSDDPDLENLFLNWYAGAAIDFDA